MPIGVRLAADQAGSDRVSGALSTRYTPRATSRFILTADRERCVWHGCRMLLALRRPSIGWLEEIVAEAAAADLTYEPVGATVRRETPAGYRADSWEVDLGLDDGSRFERCGAAVLDWAAQRGAGIQVLPDTPAANGLTFALVLPLPIGFAIATARVVHVVEDDDIIGFAYGTLPAHPEEGEEIFLVHRRAGRVLFEVSAFSRPRDPLARLGSPVTRWLQLRTNRTYLNALQTIAARP